MRFAVAPARLLPFTDSANSTDSDQVRIEATDQYEFVPETGVAGKTKMVDEEINAPFISIPGVMNFRDIGGYSIPSKPGKEVRRGIVYRSAEPSRITETGREKMRQLEIAIMYDLRSELELSAAGQSLAVDGCTGTKKIFAPVFRKEDYSPEAVALRFKTHRARPEVDSPS